MSENPDITAIITAHHEGIMAGATLRSFRDAIEHAQGEGISIEAVVYLDNPDTATQRVFQDQSGIQLVEVDFRDQGKVRNHAVQQARGEYLAFLDADDLWSLNWLTSALATAEPGRVVHPEFNYFFGDNNNILVKVDQRSPEFDMEFLRVGNYWDALCLAPRSVHLDFPYYDRDIAGGFAYEDWRWNCDTIEGGIEHVVAADTIHFKRRRGGSQSAHSLERQALVKPTAMFHYEWYDRQESN